jgi:hypothetical protein
MITKFFTTPRIAGILLLLSLLLPLVGLGVIVLQGKLAGMGAAFRGVGPPIRDASGTRIGAGFALPALIALLAGFTLVAMLSHQAGDRGFALVAMTFLVFGAVLAAIETSFHASVTVWAVLYWRSVPELYDQLRRWVNGSLQITYMSFLLTSMLLFSWSALRTRLLPAWIGWAALALSLLSFWHYFLVLDAPAVVFVTPLLIGVGLLLRR